MNPIAALTLYVASVLSAIVPTMRDDRRASIAEDIATVTISEPRAFADDASGQKTALLLVSIAHYETGRSWASWIDTGKCNDEKWRTDHPQWIKGGDCDGRHAWGMWQVHAPNDDDAVGRTYVANRQTGIRAALAKARASLDMGIGLCGYSGETYPHCKLAHDRLETARAWVVRFPFHPDTGADGAELHASTGVE
jgi:hypothetical protein